MIREKGRGAREVSDAWTVFDPYSTCRIPERGWRRTLALWGFACVPPFFRAFRDPDREWGRA